MLVGQCAISFLVSSLISLGHDNYLREQDGVCVIGLTHLSSYPLLVYDLFVFPYDLAYI